MLASVGILFVCALIALFEIPKLLRERLLKEVVIFSFLLTTGATLNILAALRIQVPNPVDLIMIMFMPITKWVEYILKW